VDVSALLRLAAVWVPALPAAEVAWRQRVFLMVWTVFGDVSYARFAALADDPTQALSMRQLVEQTDDRVITASFEAAWAERGRW
jgi:hypothetical protein